VQGSIEEDEHEGPQISHVGRRARKNLASRLVLDEHRTGRELRQCSDDNVAAAQQLGFAGLRL